MSSQKLSLFSGDDRAVSPVIGVALMIGIVVVLAGAIGFAVLDFGSDVGAEPQASVDVEQIEDNGNGNPQYRVTWVSQGNADYLLFQGSPLSDISSASSITAAGSASLPPAADASGGSTYVIDSPGKSATLTFDNGGSEVNGTVTVSAVIAENPDDSTAVVETIEN